MHKRKRAGNTITRKINSTKDTAAKADKNHYISNSYLEGFIPIDTEYFTASLDIMGKPLILKDTAPATVPPLPISSTKENGTMPDWKGYFKAQSSSSSIKKPSKPENPCSVLWMIPSLPKQSLRHGLCTRLKMRISTNPTLKGNRTMGIRLLLSCSPAMALSLIMPLSCMTRADQR